MSEEERVDPALRWWRSLQPVDGRKGDKAALARLRRAPDVAQAMVEPATFALFRAHGLGADDMGLLPRFATIAATLAHVRDHVDVRVMRRVGAQGGKADDAPLKPIRFRHLLGARSENELLTAMRRLAALAEGRLDVAELARAIRYWNDRTRARWAFEYFDAGRGAEDLPLSA